MNTYILDSKKTNELKKTIRNKTARAYSLSTRYGIQSRERILLPCII